jgi:hypothetical protein
VVFAVAVGVRHPWRCLDPIVGSASTNLQPTRYGAEEQEGGDGRHEPQ